jgi:GT2 family glycosyltransferase
MRGEIGIGITTRNRWADLTETLSCLPSELGECEIIVIDDGSSAPAPPELLSRYPRVRFERSEQSLGYIVQRNRLAQKLTAPLYLSLDDDSYPESGDFSAAVAWLNGHPEVIALAFRVLEGKAVEPEGADLTPPYPVRFYIGCAHLIRRDAFLRLDGYREELEHYCEEFEFAVRAWKDGSAVYAYPGVCVRHAGSLSGRNAERLNRLLTRNDLWIAAWHFPFARLVLSFLNALPRQLRNPAHQKYWRSVVSGYWAALWSLPTVMRKRAPLSWAQQRAWRRLAPPSVLVHRLEAPQR